MGVQNYMVMGANSISSLEGKVRDALEQGWVPQGGVAVDSETDLHKWQTPWYYQAMIYKKPNGA